MNGSLFQKKKQIFSKNDFTNSLFSAIIHFVLNTALWCSRLARQPVTLEVDGSSPFGVAKKKSHPLDGFSFLPFTAADANHLNANVRWTFARFRLDGIGTIMLSSPVARQETGSKGVPFLMRPGLSPTNGNWYRSHSRVRPMVWCRLPASQSRIVRADSAQSRTESGPCPPVKDNLRIGSNRARPMVLQLLPAGQSRIGSGPCPPVQKKLNNIGADKWKKLCYTIIMHKYI